METTVRLIRDLGREDIVFVRATSIRFDPTKHVFYVNMEAPYAHDNGFEHAIRIRVRDYRLELTLTSLTEPFVLMTSQPFPREQQLAHVRRGFPYKYMPWKQLFNLHCYR